MTPEQRQDDDDQYAFPEFNDDLCRNDADTTRKADIGSIKQELRPVRDCGRSKESRAPGS